MLPSRGVIKNEVKHDAGFLTPPQTSWWQVILSAATLIAAHSCLKQDPSANNQSRKRGGHLYTLMAPCATAPVIISQREKWAYEEDKAGSAISTVL